MREAIIVPATGMAATEATVVAWHRAEGDVVSAGDVIAEVETDKALLEIAAPADGVLTGVRYAAGDAVPVGTAIAEIATDASGAPQTGRPRPAAATPDAAPSPSGRLVAPEREHTRRDGPARGPSPLDALRDPGATELVPVDLAGTPADALVPWLRTMLVIRTFEAACEPVANAGKIPGGMHSSAGQEAVAVGVAGALRPQDILISSHRSHHTSLAKGVTPREVMAELYGKATGCVGGRGGHMHLADFGRGLWGSNGIVGGGLGIAVGVALAAAARNLDQVTVGFFGDGGANTGRVWEAINLASIWELPLIVVCENNLYAVETFVGRATAAPSVAARAAGFGLPTHQIDGQDVCAMYRTTRQAVERALDGDGPTFIEAITFRYRGHNTGDPQNYRPASEVESWRAVRDPITRLSTALLEAGMLDQHGLERLEDEARSAAEDAIAFAEESPWPDPATAVDGVLGWSPGR